MMWAAGLLAAMSTIIYPSISSLVSKNADADQQGELHHNDIINNDISYWIHVASYFCVCVHACVCVYNKKVYYWWNYMYSLGQSVLLTFTRSGVGYTDWYQGVV